jgi:hypothetical protein
MRASNDLELMAPIWWLDSASPARSVAIGNWQLPSESLCVSLSLDMVRRAWPNSAGVAKRGFTEVSLLLAKIILPRWAHQSKYKVAATNVLIQTQLSSAA